MIPRRAILIGAVSAAAAVMLALAIVFFSGGGQDQQQAAVVLNVPPPAEKPLEKTVAEAVDESPKTSEDRVEQVNAAVQAEPSGAVPDSSEEPMAGPGDDQAMDMTAADVQAEDAQAEPAPAEDPSAKDPVASDAGEPDAVADDATPPTPADAAPSTDAELAELAQTPASEELEETPSDTSVEATAEREPDPSASAENPPMVDLVVKRGVNLRSEPTTLSSVLAFVPSGERLKPQSLEPEKGYYKVAWGAREGWVWQRNVAEAEPVPAVAAGQTNGDQADSVQADENQTDSDAAKTPTEMAGTDDAATDGETASAETDSVEAAPSADAASEEPSAEATVAIAEQPAKEATPEPEPAADGETVQPVLPQQPSASVGQPDDQQTDSAAGTISAQSENDSVEGAVASENKTQAGASVAAVVSMNVNMRAKPTRESRILVTLQKGKEVLKLDEEAVRGYFLVEYGDLKGWVWRRALDVNSPDVPVGDSASAQ